ncbi:U6 snRNA-associated Sm-like protein LSm2 [Recurvomyces mirabilis]|nr:U6 snRNA-associated Sm-like protein LSm2 [Recurvomyces mirabilis]
MLFFSFFKTLVNHEVTVELKNDISIRGTLKSVDQYLNIKLDDISVVEELKYPHLSSVKNVFIRGSVVRYVHLPAAAVDTPLLEDATRRGRDQGKTGLKDIQRSTKSVIRHDKRTGYA